AYVARVHRLGKGERLLLFDPELAVEADAVIETIDRGVRVRVEEVRATSNVPAREAILLQGFPKADKFDAIVRDATELAATKIVPVITARSVAKPARDRAARWKRIA